MKNLGVPRRNSEVFFDGVVIRASVSQSVNLGFIPIVES